MLVIYSLGWIMLAHVTGMGWSAAMAQGVVQSVPVVLAKVFIAAGGAGFLVPPMG